MYLVTYTKQKIENKKNKNTCNDQNVENIFGILIGLSTMCTHAAQLPSPKSCGFQRASADPKGSVSASQGPAKIYKTMGMKLLKNAVLLRDNKEGLISAILAIRLFLI